VQKSTMGGQVLLRIVKKWAIYPHGFMNVTISDEALLKREGFFA